MSQLDEADDFYVAGRKLAKHIADSKDKAVSTATLQALIRDFLPQHEDMQEALRGIVARPDFLQLIKFAGSEKGVAQKCSVIQSLRKIYSTDTVEAADKLVCGLLSVKPPGLMHSQNGSKSNRERPKDIDKKSLEAEEVEIEAGVDVSNLMEMSVRAGELMSDLSNPQASQCTERSEQKLSPVRQSNFLRNLSLNIAIALTVGGIWTAMQNKAPQVVLLDPEIKTFNNSNQKTIDYGAIKRIPASRANWNICRAAQDVRKPTSTFGESTKQLNDEGLGRFAPVFNTRQDETWVKYSCPEIAGIYDW